MNRSYLIAIGLAVILTAWMLSGILTGPANPEMLSPTPSTHTLEPMKVQVRTQRAEPVVREIVIQGQTEPNRTVTLRAETSGRVMELVAQRGQPVKAGEVILRLAMNDRQARLRQVQALLRQRQRDFEAIQKLGQTGYQAETRVNQAIAELEAARAELERIQLDIGHTTIRAPFDGILNEQEAEIGAVVAPGNPVATLVDNSPLVVSGQISQQAIGQIGVGQSARVRLVNDQDAEGRIRYISVTADQATRTFRAEVEIANPESALTAGVSAEIRIPVETVSTHFLSPSLLTLDSQGVLGVKTVGEEERVEFHPVDIVRAGADGIWVSGLPEQARLITVGQGFVQMGERVTAIPETADSRHNRSALVTLPDNAGAKDRIN